MGGSDSKESKETSIEMDGVLNSNLVVNNEIKTTNDELELMLKLSLFEQIMILFCFA